MRDAEIAQAVRDEIAEHGWAVLAHEGEPAVAYTVGLHETFDHPEILTIGLPVETAHALLDECAADVEDGRKFAADTRETGVLEDHEVAFVSVGDTTARREVCEGAALYYGARLFDVVQLLWPDKAGRFPGDPEVDPNMAAQQPRLD